jgi:dihydroorotate dehydrogenase (fumarate)
MINLSTKYLGLELRNPIIISSSGLTSSVSKIEKLQRVGAGAIVIKSLFEEQIKMEAGSILKDTDYPEASDYINMYTRENSIDQYLKIIENTKKIVSIPIIASINCTTSAEWIYFAAAMQEAGADAIELNMFFIPDSIYNDGMIYEQRYYDILEEIITKISIPVAVKLGQHFSNIPSLVNNLYFRGAKGVVLFNRFYSPDIDVDNFSFEASSVFSSPDDIRNSLRWVGIVSSMVDKIDICASTGVHDGKAVIKQILAGAAAVQVCSVLYKKGPEYLTTIIDVLKNWMEKFNFESISDFRGRMSYKNIPDPAVFERAQFMKYFSNMI